MPHKRTPVPEHKRDATIARILQAAQRLFLENGYEKTTLQDIVKEADSSIGNVYFYFTNKEDILQTVVENNLAAAYAFSNGLASRAPAGPARLATMLFSIAYGLVGPGALISVLIGRSGADPVAQRLVDSNLERVRGYIAENLPGLSELEVRYGSITWSAAGVAMTREMSSSDDVKRDLWPAIEFLTRWDLRGLGVPEAEIDAAIAFAHEVLATVGD